MGRRQRDQERERLFTRRALLLGLGQAGLFGALGARLYYLQVIEADKYATLAEDNRINMRLLVPPRGRILDRYGEVLATSRLNYRVVLVREQAPNVEATLDAIARLITVSDTDRRRVLRDVRRKRAFVPVMVREDLSWEEVARMEVNAPDLPGVSIDVGQSRLYPHTEAVGHILGYVGAVSEVDLKGSNGDPLLELPDFRIGKNGVEKIHDQALRGVAGASQIEVNSVGRVIREVNRDDGHPGRDVELTIDIALQEYVRERVGEESTAAVVIDCHNGEILSLVSAPAFDPNMFSAGLKANDWEELQAHPKTPLTNKAVSGQYSPGSTFKMVTALAALEAGVINANQTINCPGHYELGERRFHCWKYKGGHGPMNLGEALMNSCDVYFYEIARRIGIDKISDMSQRLGIGAPLGIELPGERSGLAPTRAWYQRRRGTSWPQGETINASIGQGMILATPLQLATMTARLASGLAIVPHLTKSIGGRAPADRAHAAPASLGLNPQHLALVQRGMAMVTNEQRGTGYKARITEPGMEMAGKSGTAQVRIISKAERDTGVKKNEDLPWRFRDHALFVGFAPLTNPRFACAVVVEHGGGGSAVAGPLVRDILLETQKREILKRLAGCPTCGGEHRG
ncbi:penicillin-binding protein 2 [Elstera sp.]|jgi:penicillin-binding protein 2|uniref:penicillin-binding protein 2 n=1 Tax=Elstera sp. TaxID=1916664 RepID=UPI0037BE5900